MKGRFEGYPLVRSQRQAAQRAKGPESVRLAEERYRALYNLVDTGVFDLDVEGRLEGVNPALVRLLGYDDEDALLALDLATEVFVDAAEYAKRLRAVRAGGRIVDSKLEVKTRGGATLVVLATLHAIHDPGGVVRGYQGLLTDITEVDRLSEQLSYEASHDALTGLYNRRMFEAHLQEAVARARAGERFGLCWIDLDQFKLINDTCGHLAGDELLKQLAETLREAARREDVLARLGGDEFGLLFAAADLAQAQAGARALLAAIRGFRFDWGEQRLDTDASVGLVMLDETVGEAGEIVAAADAACYTAKDRGGGRVYVGRAEADTMNQRIGEMHWVMRIKAAIQENRLLLYQQPIAPTQAAAFGGPAHGGPLHFEILLRGLDANGKLYMPGDFLPAVERYNLGATVDRWVVEAALAWLAQHGEALGEVLCAINLSGQSVGEPAFLEFVEGRLEASGVPAETVCFEITESAAIRNLAAARRLMAALRQRGCRFSLDDFGSGLSSFAYLRNLDVDFVKLDGVFIKSITTDAVNRATVKCIVDLARAMGKETIAEFVEDAATISVLEGLGVDYVQGYAIGGPEPIDALIVPADSEAT